MKKYEKVVILLSIILSILILGTAVMFATGNFCDLSVNEYAKKSELPEGLDAQGQGISTVEQQIQDEEAYIIETNYGKLYYPQKWKENLEIQIHDEEVYVVEFYGKIEGKEVQKLFEIVFNGEADEAIGTISKAEKVSSVGFNFAELELGDVWTEEETNTIYAMQEDVNYLIGMLEKEEGFKPDLSR